ncbi:MAG: AraC family transcriptional regulator [Saprospiraceae bacterium]|nr:MAG: AraC family transcriptional regulator [Saprospiraceae bacterium]
MQKPPIVYQERKPADTLLSYFHSYWTFVYQPLGEEVLEHTIIPDGCCSILFSFFEGKPMDRALLFGPQEQNHIAMVSPNSMILGIRLMPGVATSLLGTSPETMLNQTVDATPLIEGLDYAAIFSRFQQREVDFSSLDEICSTWINGKSVNIDEKVQQALLFILENSGDIKINDLADKVHLSERQFQRRFRYEVGLSPKVFARIRRMRQAIIDVILEEKSYQDVVFERGFFDRAHLNRDFSAIAGLPPKVLEEYISRIRHIDVA